MLVIKLILDQGVVEVNITTVRPQQLQVVATNSFTNMSRYPVIEPGHGPI